MPRVKKSRNPQPPAVEQYPDPADLNFGFEEAQETIEQPRVSRKSTRNAHSNTSALRVESSSPEPHIEDSIAPHDPSLSPVRQSLLSQISFPPHNKSRPVDIRDETLSSEKVSDQYTPPSDAGIPEDAYGKSPNTESVAVSSAANTPPVEPGFSTARHSFKFRSPPVSPPQRHARPLSFGSGIPPLPSYARQPPAQYGSPPAPHLPQPHFYAAQDIDLGVPKPKHMNGDEIPSLSKFVQLAANSAICKTGLILGYERGLRLCSYDGGIVEEIGALLSLPGAVIDAEILTWSSGPDPFLSMRPLLAVNLLHTEVGHDGATHHTFCVSVYSLSQQKHLIDLLQVPANPVQHNVPNFMLHGPEFHNHLKITSAGNFMSIASGKSGEAFIFCPAVGNSGPTFECLNKAWTCIQPREPSRDSSNNRFVPTEATISRSRLIKQDENVPILAMSGRWLATCPPPTASQRTIGAVLGEDIIIAKQAGIESVSAGNRPPANCDVDSPDADTLLGKVARGVAQEMVKGARWLGDQGLQAWQNYWKKDDVTNSTMPNATYPSGAYVNPPMYEQFPPTHADTRPATRDPEIISIFDLKSFQDPVVRRSGPPTPFATFLPPHGCSFLSFAPNGLILLSASRKGDCQYVWDLLETRYCRTSSVESEADTARMAPRVRQMARFDRMSGSVIVDVVWETPSLCRFALLTKNKTIHLFELPANAMRWPPPRRLKKSRPTSAPPTESPAIEHGAVPLGGFFASAMSIAGKTQPMLANLRGRAPSSSGGLTGIGTAGFGIATATGARGSKAVASGLSKSLGAATDTVSRLHHAGESRLHLKSEKEALSGRMTWMHRASKPGLSVIADNSVKFYHVRRSKARDQRQTETTVFDARRAVTVKYPGPTAVEHETDDIGGFWSHKKGQHTHDGTIHPLSFAEIETNAPYQPFHLDRRITLSLTGTHVQETQIIARSHRTMSKSQNAWVFGDVIPTARVSKVPVHSPHDEDGVASVMYRETAVDSGQVTSTTKRRKKKIGSSQQDDGALGDEEAVFEDDFEVLGTVSERS